MIPSHLTFLEHGQSSYLHERKQKLFFFLMLQTEVIYIQYSNKQQQWHIAD